jgi:hypothetical protein
MKIADKHKTNKLSKGARLRWSPLKEGSAVKLTADMVKGRAVPDSEIKNRQSALNDKSSLLVP